MTKFIITSIDSGKILAREKNPRGEKPNMEKVRHSEDSNGMGYVDPYQRKLNEDCLRRWQEAESSLKTYPVKNCRHGIIGVEIEGEVVNGEITIK